VSRAPKKKVFFSYLKLFNFEKRKKHFANWHLFWKKVPEKVATTGNFSFLNFPLLHSNSQLKGVHAFMKNVSYHERKN